MSLRFDFVSIECAVYIFFAGHVSLVLSLLTKATGPPQLAAYQLRVNVYKQNGPLVDHDRCVLKL
jgi:hypothetical protein